ncbi:MAG: KR domain-containing protein, partial [Candidatus Electrothrix sp. ATG2]|nr:KR domain-containing protein [Candidatus Electrothrix sp. ATG2]
MEIADKTIVILGGSGQVGAAVCRALLAERPARIILVSRRKRKGAKTIQTIRSLTAQDPEAATKIISVCGDIFLRAAWQYDSEVSREVILADAKKRRQLVDDILNPLDEEMVDASLLARIIQGTASGLDGSPADIVVDCLNTATAVAYQDLNSPPPPPH